MKKVLRKALPNIYFVTLRLCLEGTLVRKRKEKQVFLLLFARLFVPFTFGEGRLHLRKTQINLVFHSICTTFDLWSKALTFDNKNKKTVICFVLFSLIRTFAGKNKKEKSI